MSSSTQCAKQFFTSSHLEVASWRGAAKTWSFLCNWICGRLLSIRWIHLTSAFQLSQRFSTTSPPSTRSSFVIQSSWLMPAEVWPPFMRMSSTDRRKYSKVSSHSILICWRSLESESIRSTSSIKASTMMSSTVLKAVRKHLGNECATNRRREMWKISLFVKKSRKLNETESSSMCTRILYFNWKWI